MTLFLSGAGTVRRRSRSTAESARPTSEHRPVTWWVPAHRDQPRGAERHESCRAAGARRVPCHGTMAPMVDQEPRYDRIAEGYARWWAPVHRPATLALLDEIAPVLDGDGDGTTLLDIGCGTGALLAEVVTRWPHVRVTGVDASAGMLAVAERNLRSLPARARGRIDLLQGTADRLPLADGSVDIARLSLRLPARPVPVPGAPRRPSRAPPGWDARLRDLACGRAVRGGRGVRRGARGGGAGARGSCCRPRRARARRGARRPAPPGRLRKRGDTRGRTRPRVHPRRLPRVRRML